MKNPMIRFAEAHLVDLGYLCFCLESPTYDGYVTNLRKRLIGDVLDVEIKAIWDSYWAMHSES